MTPTQQIAPPSRLPTKSPFVLSQAHRERQEILGDANIPSLADFIKEGWAVPEPNTPVVWNWHMDAICLHLEAALLDWWAVKQWQVREDYRVRQQAKGNELHLNTEAQPLQRIQNILFNVPPGTAKSRLVSVFMPAWMWLVCPSWRAIFLSGNVKVALRDSGLCRNVLEHEWYRDTFRPKWRLSPDQNAKSYYTNTASGSRMAIGFGAQVVGLRVDALIWDDPHDPETVHSDAVRETTIQRWDDTIYNRVSDLKHSLRIGIMQRLHTDDLAGHVLEDGDWEHVCLPMEYEPDRHETERDHIPKVTCIGWSDPRKEKGELLFPARFPREIVDKEKSKPLHFAGQYQQRPTPAAGNMFKAWMFCPWETGKQDEAGHIFWPYPADPIREAYMSWDTASKTKTTNDLTAGCITLGCDDGYTYLVPIVLGRYETPMVQKLIVLSWAQWKLKLSHALRSARLETQSAGISIAQEMPILMHQQRYQDAVPSPIWTQKEWDTVKAAPRIILHEYSTTMDMMVDAHRIQPYCNGQSVRIVDTRLKLARPWLETLMGYPLMTHDDAVKSSIEGIKPFIETENDNSLVSQEQLEKVLRG